MSHGKAQQGRGPGWEKQLLEGDPGMLCWTCFWSSQEAIVPGTDRTRDSREFQESPGQIREDFWDNFIIRAVEDIGGL